MPPFRTEGIDPQRTHLPHLEYGLFLGGSACLAPITALPFTALELSSSFTQSHSNTEDSPL